MARDTHTHKGHCPACGAIHAVSTNETLVAKHGYNTYWGYFDNICAGSDHSPLEIDKTFTEDFILGLEDFITETEEKLANFTGVKSVSCRFEIKDYHGKHDHKRIESIPAISFSTHSYRRDYEIEFIPVDEIENLINTHKCAYGSAYNDFKYDSKTAEEIIDEANKLWVDEKNRAIKGAMNHIEFLRGLIEEIHGKPLINVADGGKILKEMETEVSEGFNDYEMVEVNAYRSKLTSKRKKYLAGYEKAITKSVSIGEITLRITRDRNPYSRTGYRCHYALNEEKIAKKKLLEALGGA